MAAINELLENNARYADNFDKGDLPLPPRLNLAVVACMDARIDVHGLLGIAEGDAHVIRNAGGVITDDAIRSLTISQRLLGTTSIMLIHHTDCGMLTFRDDDVKDAIRGRYRHPPVLRPRGVRRSRRGRTAVDRPHSGQPIHP